MKPFKKCPDDFNPRSLHGERLKRHWGLLNPQKFQSTLPARGATKPFASMHGRWLISIHAPCTGSDAAGDIVEWGGADISIHAPCTGSDGMPILPQLLQGISIHAPCTGSDAVEVGKGYQTINFNPRSLHGERLV